MFATGNGVANQGSNAKILSLVIIGQPILDTKLFSS
jgi:hypothetical protein